MNKKENLRKILIYYYYKHNANWLEIEQALLTVERIDDLAVPALLDQDFDFTDFVTIFDESYPENFKSQVMPPLVFFIWGNWEILDSSSSITSLWHNVCLKTMTKYSLNNDDTYAMIYDDNLFEEYKKILNNNYKLILIGNKYEFALIDKLSKYKNFFFISEVAPDIETPSLDKDQTAPRLLFSISHNIIIFEDNLDCLEENIKYSPSSNKNIYVTNMDKVTQDEIKKYNIKKFKKKLN